MTTLAEVKADLQAKLADFKGCLSEHEVMRCESSKRRVQEAALDFAIASALSPPTDEEPAISGFEADCEHEAHDSKLHDWMHERKGDGHYYMTYSEFERRRLASSSDGGDRG